MVYPEQYVLNDFNSHAESRYQAQFSIMANSGLYTVESITYKNVNKQRHQADMLLIGRYYLNTGPPVWAHGNGHHIEYYMGQPTDMCEPVPENHISRIYYFTPFRLMGSTQGSSKSKRKRHTTFNFEAEVFETVVNFVLLLTGRLDHAHNPRGIDMTGNLQFACLAFEKNHNAEEAAKLAFQENRLSFQEHSGSQRTQRSSKLALRGVRLSEACESSTAEITPTKLPRTVVNSTSFRVQARCKPPFTPQLYLKLTQHFRWHAACIHEGETSPDYPPHLLSYSLTMTRAKSYVSNPMSMSNSHKFELLTKKR